MYRILAAFLLSWTIPVCGARSETAPGSKPVASYSANCTNPIPAPVRFNFDGTAWETPSNIIARSVMDTCWEVTPLGSNTFWSVGPPHETRLTTGPEADHTTGFGQFLHLNGLSTSLDSGSAIRMPAIDLSGLLNPQLAFWYHLYGAGIDSLEILAKASSGTSWDTIYTFRGQQQFSQTESWLPLKLSLSGYINSTVDIQFVGYGKGTDVQMALDDISVHDSASCQPSTYFRSISSDDNSVLLDWDPGSGTVHKIEYGKKGFTPGTGTRLTVGQPPFRINNLDPDTTYVFYLRDDCDSVSFSSWTGPLEVNTDCSPILAPYFEDFEGSSWPLGGLEHCWDRFNFLDFKWNVGPPALSWTQSGPGANNHTPGGAKFIVADRPNQKGKARTSITSPLIRLDSIANPELVFWSHMFGLHIIAFEVSIDSGDGFQLLKRIIGSQQLSKSAPWSEQIIALPAYAGKTVKLKFTGIASSNWSSLSRIAVDDISIGEAPSCRKSTSLQLNNLSYTSAEVGWLSGGAANWMVRLQPTGGSDSIFATSANPLSLSQLQPGAEYTIWVRDSCGPGDVGEWSSSLTFKTYCLPLNTPYFQNFDGNQFVVQSSWFSTGTLAPCWERSHELGPIWQPSPASVLPSNWIPLNDHTTGSGKFIGGVLFLGNGTNYPTSFSSPHIDLSDIDNPELSFWYFLGGLSFYSNQIRLEVNDGSGWQLMTTIYGPQQLSTSDPWLEQVVDLSGFAEDTIRLRFTSQGSSLYATTAVGIDDIFIYDVPCVEPTDLTALHVSSTTAWLGWTSGGASNWVVKHRPVGSNFQYQTTSVNDSFALNGLLPDTHYEIWVRDSCGSIVSPWHGPIFIHTECLPFQVPYYESFDGPSWVPVSGFNDPGTISSCWRRIDTIYKTWVPRSGASPSSLSGPAGARTASGNYLMSSIITTQAGTGFAEIETPILINSGLQQPELNFWYHLYGQQIQSLKVYLEKTDATRIIIDSLTGQQQTSQSDPWQQRTLPLAGFQGETFKVVFVAEIGNSLALVNAAIDDVEIIDAVCSGPVNLSANNITANTADLSWTSVSAHSSIQYGLSGFSLGAGNIVRGVTPGYSLSGLQPFTTYEYYVQDSCRTTKSTWAGPFSFTTSCSTLSANFTHQGPTLTVNFDGSGSSGTGLSYSWDFGDGSTGSGINPSHTYGSQGMYSVRLITTDNCGQSDTIAKNIQVCGPPQARISHNRSGLRVSFDASSSVAASQYYWDLGPAGIFNTDTVTAVFPAKGTYPIYLVVTNACGSKDTSFMDLVICDKPTASFTARITAVITPAMIVDFDGTASSYADSFTWYFGDGNTNNTMLTPTHVYSTSSLNYLVTLIVKADCGLSDTLSYKLSSIDLDENGAGSMAVYPNPANDRVTLTTSDIRVGEDELLWFDLSGKLLLVPVVSATPGSFEFDVSGLAAGEYLLINRSSDDGAVKVVIKGEE